MMAAPVFALIFFFGMGLLQEKNLSECWDEFKRKFPTVYLVRIYMVTKSSPFNLLRKFFFVSVCINSKLYDFVILCLVRLVYLASHSVHQLCVRSLPPPRGLRQRDHRHLGRLPLLHQALRRIGQD